MGDLENSANFDVASLGFSALWKGWLCDTHPQETDLNSISKYPWKQKYINFSTTASSLFRFWTHPITAPPEKWPDQQISMIWGYWRKHNSRSWSSQVQLDWYWMDIEAKIQKRYRSEKGRTYPEIYGHWAIPMYLGKMMITRILTYPKVGDFEMLMIYDDLAYSIHSVNRCYILQDLVKSLDHRHCIDYM